jgi:ATP-dependent protease Clp ATPase subunit
MQPLTLLISFVRHGTIINMMTIQDCGKKEMIETISKFLHVPLLVIHDAHQLRAYASKIEMFVAERLLEYSSYDLEKASAGIVVLRNVNHLGVDVQRSIAGLMRGGNLTM